MALAAFQSCQEMDPNGTVNSSKEYGFNINVNGGKGFSDAATKSVKSGWENGDRIFLFFSGKSDYVTMTYSGGSWTASPETISGIDASGQLAAVYAPYFSETPSYFGGSWTIESGDVYYCEDKAHYTVENGAVTAVLDMVIPGDYVQFYITGVDDSDELTCNNVECWKDITINGSSLTVSSKTDAGDTMTGCKFSSSDNGIVFYGRLKSGDLPTDCELTVTNSGKTYQRTITGKHLTGRTAYTLGAFSTSGPNSWSLKESRPEGALPGKFSVSDTKQVYFSQGNLWADASGNFYFEESQYNISTTTRGEPLPYPIDGDNVPWSSDHIRTFYWSTDAANAYSQNEKSCFSTDTDVLFTNETTTTPNPSFSVNNQAGIWRTLSGEEWKYLFNYGTHANEKRPGLYAYGVTVNGCENCIVLYPDGYKGTIVNDATKTTLYDETAEYSTATAEGIVFLPPGGERSRGNVYYYTKGFYLASTPYPYERSYCVKFSDKSLLIDVEVVAFAHSIRLVTDCN